MAMHTDRVPCPTSATLTLKTHGVVVTSTLRNFVQRRLSTSLGRFIHRTREIFVWLEDVNGPRGGHDIRCRLEIHLKPSGRLIAQADATDEYMAVSLAAERARAQIDQRLKKARARRRSARRKPRTPDGIPPSIQTYGRTFDPA